MAHDDSHSTEIESEREVDVEERLLQNASGKYNLILVRRVVGVDGRWTHAPSVESFKSRVMKFNIKNYSCVVHGFVDGLQ